MTEKEKAEAKELRKLIKDQKSKIYLGRFAYLHAILGLSIEEAKKYARQ